MNYHELPRIFSTCKLTFWDKKWTFGRVCTMMRVGSNKFQLRLMLLPFKGNIFCSITFLKFLQCLGSNFLVDIRKTHFGTFTEQSFSKFFTESLSWSSNDCDLTSCVKWHLDFFTRQNFWANWRNKIVSNVYYHLWTLSNLISRHWTSFLNSKLQQENE